MVALVGFVIWWFKTAPARSAARAEQAALEAKAAAEAEAQQRAAFNELITRQMDPITVPGFVPDGEEKAYLTCEGAIISQHVVKQRVGGGRGVSVRVARGVWVRQSIPSRVVTKSFVGTDDVGRVVVTDHRFIFMGGNKSMVVSYKKLVNVIPYIDGFRLDVENKHPVVFRTGSIMAAVALERARRGLLSVPAEILRQALSGISESV